jgi:hypothetical protein
MNEIVPVELVNDPIRKLSYSVLADLNNDGVFETDISDDCTIDYVNIDLEIKVPGEGPGKPSSSNASITLFNETTKYSPYKNNQLVRNTKVRILAGFVDNNGTSRVQELFQGVITDIKTSNKNGTVTYTLKDLAKFLQKKKNPNHTLSNGKYYEGILFDCTIDDAVSYLIDYALGTSFNRDIDHFTLKYPCIEFPKDQNIWATLQKLAEAVGAKMFFEGNTFKFYSPMISNHYNPEVSQYTFIGDNIFDLNESINEDDIINKWIIESNGKTLQPRQVIVGTPSTNVLTGVDYYKTGDGKNAVNGAVITLKSQDDNDTWIDSLNVPLVDTTTYVDLYQPDQDAIDNMNSNSIIKVWDRINNKQLTIKDIDCKTGKITLVTAITGNYDLQITYQYNTDQIIHGKYRDYEYSFDKVCRNIELPDIEVHDGFDMVTYSTDNSVNTLYLSNWEVLDGNQRVKFRLTNNVPVRQFVGETLDTVSIAKMEISGNPLDCVNPLSVKAEDATTLEEFENSYTITNDYIIDEEWGKQLTDYYLFRNKDSKSYIDITTKGIPQLQLLDRVTLVENTSGHNDDFIVIAIKHTPRIDGWKTNATLEALKPAWAYDSSHVQVTHPIYDNGSMLTLPVVNITSNDTIEDVFANNAVTHSVVINFTQPSQLNITDFLEGRILYQVYNSDTSSWGRYITSGSFNDNYASSYKINGLLPDHQYRFFVIVSNRRNNQSPYGDGYILNTPTTEELMAKYGIIAAPVRVQILKGISNTLTASVTRTSAPHYKSTTFQMVRIDLPFEDASMQELTSVDTSELFEFPDERNYKLRARYTDIWNRPSNWSPESNISGGKISDSDVQASFLEVQVSSDIAPISGDLNNLIDGTESAVVFDKPAVITYKYPYTNIFNIARIRVSTDTDVYVQVKDTETSNWENVIGSKTVPVIAKANTLGSDANVFYFTENGDPNGKKKKKCVREVQICFTSAATIEDIKIDTFGYFDELVVNDADIKSAMIESVDASKLVVGDDPLSLPTLINSANDILFHFDNTSSSTQGELPVENSNTSFTDAKYGSGVVVGESTYLSYTSKIKQESTISFWYEPTQTNNSMVIFGQGDS